MCYIAMCGAIGAVFFSAFGLKKVSILTNFVLALGILFTRELFQFFIKMGTLERCLTFADCRPNLGLNSALVSLNSTQVSLFTVSFREWK